MKCVRVSMLAMLLALVCGTAGSVSEARAAEDGFVSLFNGKDLTGWKINENEKSWRVEDGAIVCKGERSHLFYVGDKEPFKNFELRLKIMTKPKANAGVYFHTQFQPSGWPKYGFEAQVNNTSGDPKRGGSLYSVVDVKEAPAKDNEWYTMTVRVDGNKVTIKCNDKVTVDWTEPADRVAGKDFTRKLDQGTFALQSHDPGSEVFFKDIEVKRLP